MEAPELDNIATRYVNWSKASPGDRRLSALACAIVFVGWGMLPALIGSDGQEILIPIEHAIVTLMVTWFTVGKRHYQEFSRPSFERLSETQRLYIAHKVREQLGDDFDVRRITHVPRSRAHEYRGYDD